MYTELIFGVELKKDCDPKVIDILKFMLGRKEKPINLPDHKFFKTGNWRSLFLCSSYYFGYSTNITDFKFDYISNAYKISTRSSLKNYDNEISLFMDWITPYIYQGSGARDMIALETYEEASEPKIYYLIKEERGE